MEMRKIVTIDEELCDGCGNCIVACAESALQLVNGKAKKKAPALESCPQKRGVCHNSGFPEKSRFHCGHDQS